MTFFPHDRGGWPEIATLRPPLKIESPSATGSASVLLPPGPIYSSTATGKASGTPTNPAAELKALLGQWKVVRVEKGNAASWSWNVHENRDRMNFRAVDFIYVREETLDFLDYYQAGMEWELQHIIYPTARQGDSTFASGNRRKVTIRLRWASTALDGERLRICLARYLPSVKSDQRPKSFVLAADSGDTLLVLGRYKPSGDEKAIQGDWSIVSQAEDGKSLSKEELLARKCSFGAGMIGIQEDRPERHGQFDFRRGLRP